MTGMFLASLDQSVVSTAIRTISDDLKGLDIQAWVSTAYLITSTISTPIYGKLSDIYGRKKFFLLAIVLFVIGSLLCTIATTMYHLAAFRAVQGLGAGGLMSLINVPLGIIALLTVNATLHLHHVRQHATIDWGGAAALVVGLVPLLVIAEQGQA
ncbi:MFS transporter [Aestuariimicrobium sp. p3-SID1156]|uniref:MFS transporter n=1 Tax=Aestuariimicrobium sp. p3-SID1156 TaxID=2916038 RepID=UPI00223BD6F7|nr:MFS transporter [Aestuariimicrobium sp. p3-SID1156]MCT1458966.1 MFS transporter [Aestuariimicrobium sp. p3-SID1156]